MSYNRTAQNVHCFSCNTSYDIFDLIGIDYGIADYNGQLAKACSLYGITLDNNAADKREPQQRPTQRPAQAPAKDPEEILDFTSHIEQAHNELLASPEAIEHYTARGLTLETIKRFKLGYAAKGLNSLLQAHPEHQSGQQKESLYKYVLPFITKGKACYFVAEISDRGQTDDFNGKYAKPKGLTQPLFNEDMLQDPPPVIYICEGIFDALSYEQLGARAIALAGTGHNRLISLVKRYKPKTQFIIALDNDEAGRRDTPKIAAALKEAGAHGRASAPKGGKDANEVLQKDPEQLAAFIKKTTEQALQQPQEQSEAEPELTLEEQRAAYNETTVKAELGDVLYNIINGRSKACYKTNMPQLDAALDGGLYPGLYFFGAVSALGKTSLALQMCDNLAAAGNDVIIFSLEMAMEELVAKSVSRLTYTKLINAGLTTENAKTTRGILTGSRYSRYSEAEKRLINEAFNEYGETTGKHLRIIEGTGNIGVKQIRETVEKHIRLTGKTPIILIDYLQILAPEQLGASDKQNTDRAVFKLKELSREYGIPILGISSFNRNNYSMGVNLGSFKESGAIEYSSDMLIGMQYAGTDQRARGTDRTAAFKLSVWTETMSKLAERGESQPIEFKILKHRNGAKSTVYFLFYPRFNYFECITKEQTLQRIEEILPLEQQVKEEKEETAKARAKARAKATSTHKDKTDEYNELKASLDAAFKEADPEGKGEAPLKKVAYNMQMTEQKLKRELKQFSLYRHEKGIIYFSQPTDQEPEPSLLEPDF
jgi:replicative DNA helicase